MFPVSKRFDNPTGGLAKKFIVKSKMSAVFSQWPRQSDLMQQCDHAQLKSPTAIVWWIWQF